MNENFCKGIEDLLALFEDSLSPAEVLTAKLISQVSSSITRERLKLQMNQSEFAEHIGARQSLVSRWEHGDYNFSIKKIAEIAAALNMDVNITMNDIEISKSYAQYTDLLHYSKVVQYPSKPTSAVSNKCYVSRSDFTTTNYKEENYSCYNSQTVSHVPPMQTNRQ